MNEQSRFTQDFGRRVATIDGQLKGIERLLQKEDVPQVLTQASAVRNALESLVRVVLQTSITQRFAMASLSEGPHDVFQRSLERAMTYWFSSNLHDSQAAAVSTDGEEFWIATRRHVHKVQDLLREAGIVLEGEDYLRALRELGSVHREVNELMSLMLSKFIKDRMADKAGSGKEKESFERTVEEAMKYWHLPDPRFPTICIAPGKHILVVDDDPDIVEYLRHVLEKQDYEVATAANAEEAMRKVETEKPDLIVLDVMMPKGTEGFHFTWNLRSRPETEYRNIPIIVLTAIHGTTQMRFYPDQSDGYYGPGEYLPVEGFLDKPVKEQDLLREVERVLGTAGQDARRSG
jgi:CheY-like chemotaxis protein/DNA-binding FrmR family transcriptional regulator